MRAALADLDMLKEVGTTKGGSAMFIPHAPGAVSDVQGQVSAATLKPAWAVTVADSDGRSTVAANRCAKGSSRRMRLCTRSATPNNP